MLGNNQLFKCVLSVFLIADLHVILSTAEDDTHYTKSRRDRPIRRFPENMRISWPTGKAAMEYRRQQQQEHMERNIGEDSLPQGDQLHVLLNCNAFSHVIRLLQGTEIDLKASLQKEDDNTTDLHLFRLNRARLWVHRLHAQMHRVYRSCLPFYSLKRIIETQSGTFANDQQPRDSQRPNISSPVSPRKRKNGRKQQIPILNEQGHFIDTNVSRSVHNYKRHGSTISRKIPSINGHSPAVDSYYLMNVNSLSSDLVHMVSKNSSLDIMTILQRLVNFEEELDPQNQLHNNTTAGDKVTIEIRSIIREIPPYFLSVAIAPRIFQHGILHHITRSKKFMTLSRGLSPAVLRMGGSAANFLTFDTTNKSEAIYSNSNPRAISHEGMFNDEGEKGHFPQDRKTNPLINYQNKRSFAASSKKAKNEEHNSTDISAFDNLESADSLNKATSQAASRILTHSNERRHGDQELNEHKNDDDCVFDFKWHSLYKTKPQNDSTYDILAAMFSESKVDEDIQVQDQPSETDDNPCGYYGDPDLHNFTMEAGDFARLIDFVESTGMFLLFDINQFYRTPEGDWDPTNAKMIFREAASRNENILWQLGNEPNAYHFHYGFNFTGKRDAQDYHMFYKELKKVFRKPRLVGPDVTRPKHPAIEVESGEIEDICKGSVRFLEDFLRHLRVNLTTLSWHHYYVNGQKATLEDFTSVDVLDQLSWQIPQIVGLRDKYSPDTPIWLTETSSAFGGGADGLSNRYVAGFLWLDKLGMAAASGIDMVARQTLIYGSYALMDSKFNPYPDYWLSLLFKTLVGERVLSLHLSETSSSTEKVPQILRIYAHCQKPTSKSYKPGNIVIYGMNLGNTTGHMMLKSIDSNYNIEQYLLEPTNNLLTSRDVSLNGEELQMTSEEHLPELKPLLLPDQDFQIPSFSYGFWVINGAGVVECI